MRPASSRPMTPRRGLTLVEMLVTVALLLLIMSIVVAIFQSATTAMTTAQTDADLAQVARRFDATIRQDLEGATARFTPPVNTKDGRGYFEYSEGALSDAQGEDSDDTIAMTVKAPAGQPFSGRMMLQVPGTGTASNPLAYRQVTITSQYAEVLYFLRNGNLYRRVLLIVPSQAGLEVGRVPSSGAMQYGGGFNYSAVLNYPFGASQPVSWQGMNDISAHAASPPAATPPASYPVSSYIPVPNTLSDLTNREYRIFRPQFANDYFNIATGAVAPDGKPDDLDVNGIPDFYPTLYPNAVINGKTTLLNNASYPTNGGPLTHDTLPFPFLFPGAYSKPNPFTTANYGAIHTLNPDPTNPIVINHSPLDIGDSLPVPTSTSQYQTWWGLPTWRETLSPFWTSPVKRINDPSTAPYFGYGFLPAGPRNSNDTVNTQSPGLSRVSPLSLPPVTDQPYTDDAGVSVNGFTLAVPAYQDDILVTGVRSFDVKAYDPNASAYGAAFRPNYYDLGYASEFSYTDGTTRVLRDGFASAAMANAQLPGFGHEGRIPPLTTDFRSDPQWPRLTPNLGDDTTSGANAVVRLRRVWDSWSTAYTNAPDVGIDPTAGAPFARPVYPSYPAPYPAALRSIQIQIRIVDPRNERVKVLTVRHDFTDKL
jgi:prepilin-type N-terminal cleavage/methylation domain-containing protein